MSKTPTVKIERQVCMRYLQPVWGAGAESVLLRQQRTIELFC